MSKERENKNEVATKKLECNKKTKIKKNESGLVEDLAFVEFVKQS